MQADGQIADRQPLEGLAQVIDNGGPLFAELFGLQRAGFELGLVALDLGFVLGALAPPGLGRLAKAVDGPSQIAQLVMARHVRRGLLIVLDGHFAHVA